jgi:serine/threonine-protein kinase
MGSVWVADHLTLHTEVAVKFLAERAQRVPEAISRFSAEAAAAARIKSPHVVQVFDHGVSDGTPYIVMELLEGEDLAQRLARDRRLSPAETVAVIGQVCKALEKAHALGVIHRDIKPANLFLASGMGDTFVKVLDFGLAKNALEMAGGMTGSGAIFGTPHYISPEQAESARAVTAQSDLWSVAVVAYECLTGSRPFDADSLMGLCVALNEGRFKPPTTVCPELPLAADAWFKRAFELEPAQRFASATELAASFAALLSDIRPSSADAPRTAWSDTSVRTAPRRDRWIGIAGALAVATAGILLLRPAAEPAVSRPPVVASAVASSDTRPSASPPASAPSMAVVIAEPPDPALRPHPITPTAPATPRQPSSHRPTPSAASASTTKHELFSDPKN